jgi:hypothetical protein
MSRFHGLMRSTASVACVTLLVAIGANARRMTVPPGALASPKVHDSWTLRRLDDTHWELYIENTDPSNFLTRFEWAAPVGLNVESITAAIGGTCALGQDQVLRCVSSIAPEACATCAGSGMTIDFVASGFATVTVHDSSGTYLLAYGWTPGFLVVTGTSPTFPDLPYCATGTRSTPAARCTKR